VAVRKVRALIKAGALVTIASPRLCAEIDALAASEKRITLHRTAFDPGQLEGARLVVAATDDSAVNEAVSREARARGILVNVVDQPALSTFIVPAQLSRGLLQVVISTGGASPAFARRLRERLEGLLSPRLAAYLATMAKARALVIEQVSDPERRMRIFEELAGDDCVASYIEAEPTLADAMLMERVNRLIAQAGVKQ